MSEPEVLAPREVPLGGVRALLVRRALPHRDRRMVGAWCFLDDYGPTEAMPGRTMDVPPHPHTALQTVTWLLDGEVHHRDSLGTSLVVRPGELNLMTAGRGISHSEVSLAGPTLRGVQLWVALPGDAAGIAPRVDHHDDLPTVDLDAVRLTVILGDVRGAASAAPTYTPIVGAEWTLTAPEAVLPLDTAFEHGVVPLTPGVVVAGAAVPVGGLRYVPPGTGLVRVEGPPGSRGLLVGGAPFEERLVMWWNFVGRSHDEIVAARADWESGRLTPDPGSRFGVVPGHDPAESLPAPVLPSVPLLPRGRHRAVGGDPMRD